MGLSFAATTSISQDSVFLIASLILARERFAASLLTAGVKVLEIVVTANLNCPAIDG